MCIYHPSFSVEAKSYFFSKSETCVFLFAIDCKHAWEEMCVLPCLKLHWFTGSHLLTSCFQHLIPQVCLSSHTHTHTHTRKTLTEKKSSPKDCLIRSDLSILFSLHVQYLGKTALGKMEIY